MKRIVEIWVPLKINDEETQYLISDAGRIKSKKSINLRKTHKNKYGYEQIHLCHNNKSYTKRVHRLVAEAFIPNPEHKKTINHIAKGFDSRSNNDVNNLEWATSKEQVLDCIKKGTFVGASSCEHNIFAGHTNKQVHESCALLEKNELTLKEISNITGVNINVLHKIVAKAAWTDISDLYQIDKYTINRPMPKNIKKKILNLYLDGYKFKDICNELGLPINNKTRCIFYQIKTNYKKKSSTTIENDENQYYTIDIHI